MAHIARNAPYILTLDGSVLLSKRVRDDFKDIPLQMVSEDKVGYPNIVEGRNRHAWCPLFDQLELTLSECGVATENDTDCLDMWFINVSFKSMVNELSDPTRFLSSMNGRALEHLVEEGFSLIDPHGQQWHYTVFEMSASMARNQTVSFIADTGYDALGNAVHISDRLNQRLCLDMDFQQIEGVAWSKYYAYRGLSLTSSKRACIENGRGAARAEEVLPLTSDTVLVLDMGETHIPCDVRCVRLTAGESRRAAEPEFFVQRKEEGGSIRLNRFDGEGLISPAWADFLRRAVYGKKQDADITSFQIRMPFAKGVVHEVDFTGFLKETLNLDQLEEGTVFVEDAFGIKRDISKVQMVLTTDMLKCHAWLEVWVRRLGVPDPMRYYFEKLREYQHTLYVLPKLLRQGASGKLTTNAQYLSTLRMSPDGFDAFVNRSFAEASSPLFSQEKARDLLLTEQVEDAIGRPDGESTLDWITDDTRMLDATAWYALSLDPSFVNDPHLHSQLLSAVNSSLIDIAMGKIPVEGTYRLLSDDLLMFLEDLAACIITAPENSGAFDPKTVAERLAHVRQESLDADELFIPGHACAEEMPWAAVLRNPHLSRSEQCLMRPVQAVPNGFRERYLGHLTKTAMVSCESAAPMILGGADFDGDAVHIYEDASIIQAVREGAYEEAASSQDGEPELTRRFPIANLAIPKPELPMDAISSHEEDATAKNSIGKHMTCTQLVQSFQSNVGLLSNAALTFSGILYDAMGNKPAYGRDEHALEDDLCANYTIAVGADIDSVKTGIRLSTDDLRISRAGQTISRFGITGKSIPDSLGFIAFRDQRASALRTSSTPLWNYQKIERPEGDAASNDEVATLKLYLKKPQEPQTPSTLFAEYASVEKPALTAVDLDADLSLNNKLKGAFISNVERLPTLLIHEAERIRSLQDVPSFLGSMDAHARSPLEDYYHAQAHSWRLDEGRLDTLQSLIMAHHHAMTRLKRVNWIMASERGSQEFGKARRCAQEYPTRFSHEETLAILGTALLDIREFVSTQDERDKTIYEKLLRTFKDDGFTQWAVCPATKRRQALDSIIPGLIFREDFYSLLEDDALLNGFMIPFHLLRAAHEMDKEQARLFDDARPTNNATEEDRSDAGRNVRRDPAMYSQIVSIINHHLDAKVPRADMEAKVLAALKARICQELHDDEVLLQYLCSLKYQKRCFNDEYYNARILFWELLAPNDLREFEEWLDVKRMRSGAC